MLGSLRVRELSDFIKNILICVQKMKEGLKPCPNVTQQDSSDNQFTYPRQNKSNITANQMRSVVAFSMAIRSHKIIFKLILDTFK